MTVICWDGRTLAADKRACSGNVHRTVTKIERCGPYLLAMTGSWDVAAEMREWFKAGADTAAFPAKARDDVATLIVIGRGFVDSYAAGPVAMRIEDTSCAWGCGRDFALTAMHLGKSPREAVEIAALFDPGCGNGVDVLEL